ncbi:MAG TPA: adenosylcobinamide-phosphate synthase CbiB [Rhizobacter sp.]|nr:adenosylcobinamide-phosphate synthase CbiB [Rhizobacter sp.]
MSSLIARHPQLSLLLALLLAWALDALFGEPPEALHPVAWLGRLLWPLGCRLRSLPPRTALCSGALIWAVLAGALGTGAWWLQARLLVQPVWLSVPLLALLLKPMFTWRALHDEVAAVEDVLEQDIESARERLSQLVSRDVSALNEAMTRETAIEALAENLSDCVVAPLFWFAVFGLPGAVVYRFANTADAMWGYRGIWEWTGKWAVRANDVCSWVPARVTALLLRPICRRKDWRTLKRHARRTPSPNSGWPMSAMALRLGVRLSKHGAYVINESGVSPTPASVARGLSIAATAAWAGMLLAVFIWALRAL